DEMKENQAELLKVVGTALARIQRPTSPAPSVTVEPQIHVSPAAHPKPVAWRFEFERDSNDRIKAMTATPIL
ncbi:MAG: hypothetical protein AAB131_03060, partial [Actinomycetota bacterium]